MVDDLGSSRLSPQPRLWTCAFCTTPARYKCPRCATPTCSLPCSRKHKQDTKCTGERDKVQYVPMNAYGWGTMMRDYCYLEEIGRKVSDWGCEIVHGGYMGSIGAGKYAGGRGSSTRKSITGKSRRDLLRDHLETLGIEVELLPAGMERKNMNQSTFDQKSKCPLLTIELVFYPPTITVSISPLPPSPHKTLSHRNDLSATLLSILQRQASSKPQKQKEAAPDWLPTMVTPHPEAPECFVPPHCYIRAHTEFPEAPNVAYYHKLEPSLNLGVLLQRTSFIEFPTIHVFDAEASSFSGTIIDKFGSIVRALDDDRIDVGRVVKRRKLNRTMGIKSVWSLVGEYGSEDSSSSDQETFNKGLTGLATLEAYTGSDDEAATQKTEVEEDPSLSSDDNIPFEDTQPDPDPARLLELLRQARGAADEDILDWGDEWDLNAEEHAVNDQPT